jgi:hypothetical protein
MTQHLQEPLPREYEASDVLPVLADFYGEMLFLFDDVSIRDFAEVKELLRAVPPLATKILTTRSEDVSNELGLRYLLERLDTRDSLELLHARLRDRFGSGQGAPSPEAFEQLLTARESVLLAELGPQPGLESPGTAGQRRPTGHRLGATLPGLWPLP